MLVQFQKASIPYAISDDCFPSSVASSVFACYLQKATAQPAKWQQQHSWTKCLPSSFIDKRKINAHGAIWCILQYALKHYSELVTWYFISRKKQHAVKFVLNQLPFNLLSNRRHGKKCIILLFGQHTEPPRSLSRPKIFHVNQRKIEK